MSNMTHGMTVDQVEDLGRLLQARADQMRQLVSEVESALGGTSWIGPDADAFRHQWWPDHRSRLQAAAEAIHGFGQSALNNATEQQTASGVASSVGAAGAAIGAGAVTGVVGGGMASAGGASRSGAVTPSGRSPADVQAKYEAWARSAGGSQAGVSFYQCTGWANFRFQELYPGAEIVGGHGGAMAYRLSGEVSDTPMLHTMASYGAGVDGHEGHVMIVEEVAPDGSWVRVSEMNKDFSGTISGFDDKRVIYKGSDGWMVDTRSGKEQLKFAVLPG